VPTLANGGISADGRTITYRLRHGVRWQDGAPLGSADVAFTIRAVNNPRNTIGSRFPYDTIAAVETPDASTVRLRLRAPDASFTGIFLTVDSNAAILPDHLLSKFSSLDRVPFDALPVGSGPYRVERWDRGTSLRLVSNPIYYGGAPQLPAIELRYRPDTTTALVGLQTGELDGVLSADVALFQRYRTLAGARVTNLPYVGATVLGFNTERPLLGDPAMRRALAQEVDAEALVREAFHGAVTSRDATRGLFSYADDARAPWPHYDPVAASRTLDRLGWRRDAAGIRRRSGRALALSLTFPNASAAYSTAAVILQQEFARAGVRLDLQSFAYSQYYGLATDGGPLANGRFDLALIAYSTDVDPDQRWLLGCSERGPRGFNWSRYCSARADALSSEATTAFERARRVALIARLQRRVALDVPFLPLWQAREIDVTPRTLRGFVPDGALPFDSARNWAWR